MLFRVKKPYFKCYFEFIPTEELVHVIFPGLRLSEAVTRKCSVKKVSLKILQNSQEDLWVTASGLCKVCKSLWHVKFFRKPISCSLELLIAMLWKNTVFFYLPSLYLNAWNQSVTLKSKFMLKKLWLQFYFLLANIIILLF